MGERGAKRHPIDEQFVEEFASRILDKAAGNAEEFSVVNDTSPRRLFFNGILCPEREDQTPEQRRLAEIYKPRSCGLDFVCATDSNAILTIELKFNVYGAAYQRFETLDARTTPIPDYAPPVSYVRYPVSKNFTVSLADMKPGLQMVTEASDALNAELSSIGSDIQALPNAIRETDCSVVRSVRLHEWTESSYARSVYLGDKAVQEWKGAIYVQTASTPIGRRIQVFLYNDSVETVGKTALDMNFYGVELAITVPTESLREIPLERAPLHDYRYTRAVTVQGINCNSEVVSPGVLRTCFAPTFKQMRYLPLEGFDLTFNRLEADLDSALNEIETAMASYQNQWNESLRVGKLGIESQSDLEIATEFFRTFNGEVESISAAADLVRRNQTARDAFTLMNRAFGLMNERRAKQGGPAITGWYLFQLAFILSLVPKVVERSLSSAEEAHLLWFPTGGGKTEAVMGVAVFAMFFERLSGRGVGVTGWMRFPLRLLTFQQMQRYVDVVIAADEVRIREEGRFPELGKGAFTIGYFGGRRNSPNDLRTIPEDLDVPDSLYNRIKREKRRTPRGIDVLLDSEGRALFQDMKVVADCLYCGSQNSIEIVGDPELLALRHRCSACQTWLPVFIVDDDIYTQLPTLVIGTLDKLATIGFRSGFRTIVGKSDGKCKKHGHGTFGRCIKASYGECGHSEWIARRHADPEYGGIAILFQDELHLIHEQLGCFDAHYESLLISLCAETTGKAPLIIAASATIEGAQHQLEHLYGASMLRFPGEGPSLRETFYAKETSDLQRLFVGIRPSNLAHLDTTMSLVTFIFDELSQLRNNRAAMETYYPSLRLLDPGAYEALLDRHTLTVAYVNSKREGQNIYRSVDEQVRDNLTRFGDDEIYGLTSLSGDSTMDEVKEALRRMKTRRTLLADQEKLDFAVATSMISHGVDVDRLNSMIFFSYPRTTAEYIQASSRAGRTYPGIVFVVLKSTTYRDRSFYRNFREVHAALDKMVETVPIDRFAVHAVERTAPGVATGTLIHRGVDALRKANAISLEDAREVDNVQTLKRLVIQGLHFKDSVIGDLQTFYRVSDPRAADWRSDLLKILDRLDTNIASVGDGSRSIPMELNYSTTRVMTSLRDVDPPLEVLIRGRISTERELDDNV